MFEKRAVFVLGLLLMALLALIVWRESRSAQASAEKAMNSRVFVTLYDCAGKPIKAWESAGVVTRRDVGDTSYRFLDKKTAEIVAINGTYVVESKP